MRIFVSNRKNHAKIFDSDRDPIRIDPIGTLS